MKLKNICSNRFFETQAYMDIVQEWEDEFSNYLKIPLVTSEYVIPFHEKLVFNNFSIKFFSKTFLIDVIQKIDRSGNSNSKSLFFELYPVDTFYKKISVRANTIPIIIDYWKFNDPNQFYKIYRNCKIILISSLEVLEFLRQSGIKIPMFHLPISLPNKYKNLEKEKKNKLFDIVLAGRRDEMLGSYLKHFCNQYKDVEYVFQVYKGRDIFYESNKKGIIGNVTSREDYWNLIKSGLVSFYSTPGMDEGVKKTGGFNPVTPRYLELLSANNYLMGRYPKNEETDFFELEKVCPNVQNYEHFETLLLKYLNKRDDEFDTSSYNAILNKHYTSSRIQQLLGYLNDLNEK